MLLLTPTGSLPSPGWRWWARGMVAAPVVLLLVVTLAGGPLDLGYQARGGPFDLRGLGGILLVANQAALAVTTLGVVVAAASLVGRFGRARGTERLRLRWVAWAAVLVVLGGVAVLTGLAVGVAGATTLLGWGASAVIAVLPLAIGAAILRYRLYDLDRIIGRTLAHGLLTVLLGGCYAGVVLGLVSCSAATRVWWWPGRPWRWRRWSGRPAARPAAGGPALQPAPLRRRPHDSGVQRAAAWAGGPGHPD